MTALAVTHVYYGVSSAVFGEGWVKELIYLFHSSERVL